MACPLRKERSKNIQGTGEGPMLIGNKFYPLFWLIIGILVLAMDYVIGPLVQFPVAFVLPVILASWYSGRSWRIP